MYGHGVEQAEVFAERVDLGEAVEVINLGTPGYSSAQTLNLMNMRGWQLEPDLIVIANLWSDNNFDSFVDRELLSERHNPEDSIAPAASAVLQKSAIYRWLDWHLRLAPRADEVKTVGWMLGQTPTGGYRRVSVNDYAANLQRLCDEADDRGARVAFLALANAVDLGAQTDGAIAWSLYREVMAAVAKRNGAPLVEVVPAFAESGLSHELLFLDEMHPTAAGHKIIADTLTDALQPWLKDGDFGLPSSQEELPRWDDPFSRGEGPPKGHSSAARVTLSGSVIGVPEGIPVQIDLIDLDPDRPENANPIVGSARFDHVDAFEMPAPHSGLFGVRIYLDREGDGPTSGDPVFTLDSPPINAVGMSLSGIVLNLEDSTITWVRPRTTSRDPQTSPDE